MNHHVAAEALYEGADIPAAGSIRQNYAEPWINGQACFAIDLERRHEISVLLLELAEADKQAARQLAEAMRVDSTAKGPGGPSPRLLPARCSGPRVTTGIPHASGVPHADLSGKEARRGR
ncbi:hypothetical protein BC739_006728 [Kutzneria viridogrisea]|uniref:Uncharacterized protein n=1 Tax=Kutzneria viridogrisea TaxID=47990 RepID=A0ABR6BRJ8_9PSEU|nr:hypothetical protein [Kutzneria viridogrisea]